MLQQKMRGVKNIRCSGNGRSVTCPEQVSRFGRGRQQPLRSVPAWTGQQRGNTHLHAPHPACCRSAAGQSHALFRREHDKGERAFAFCTITSGAVCSPCWGNQPASCFVRPVATMPRCGVAGRARDGGELISSPPRRMLSCRTARVHSLAMRKPLLGARDGARRVGTQRHEELAPDFLEKRVREQAIGDAGGIASRGRPQVRTRPQKPVCFGQHDP